MAKKINLGSINKTTAWILWGVGMVVIVVLFTMSIRPRFKRYDSLKTEIAKERQNIAMVKEVISKREEYESEIEYINQKIKYYEGKLPQEKEADALLEELARIATDSKIKYQFIRSHPMASLQTSEISLPYSSWPITMRLACGFHELGMYINQLENARRFIRVDSLTIDAGEDIFQHQVTLNLITYVAGK